LAGEPPQTTQQIGKTGSRPAPRFAFQNWTAQLGWRRRCCDRWCVRWVEPRCFRVDCRFRGCAECAVEGLGSDCARFGDGTASAGSTGNAVKTASARWSLKASP